MSDTLLTLLCLTTSPGGCFAMFRYLEKSRASVDMNQQFPLVNDP